MFGENEWEGPLFCGKRCFKHHKKALNAAAIKPKGEYHGITMAQLPNINFMAVMIDWLTQTAIKIDGAVVINKMVL